MKASIIASYLGPEPESIPRLAEIGYRRVEVIRRESASAGAAEIRAAAERAGVEIHSVMCWHPGLADAEEEPRQRAWQALVDNIAWTADLGASVLEVVPMWKGPGEQYDEAWQRAVDALRRGGEQAAASGVVLAIEPVNRWETRLVNTLAQGARMAAQVGHPAVKVMGDTHHMHISEHDLTVAVQAAAPYLVHMHFSDSDRQVPGLGLMDLPRLVNTLARVGYRGSLSLSEMTREGDREANARLALAYTEALVAIAEARAACA